MCKVTHHTERKEQKEVYMKTVDYSEFHRERRRVEMELNKPFGETEIIWFYDTSDDEVIRMGLNIASTGRMDIAKATVFAEAVSNAVQAAKTFKYNGYTKTYGEDY